MCKTAIEICHDGHVSRISNWIHRSLVGRGFPTGLAVLIYTFSYGQNLLLGNTYFWDDWQNRITKAEFAAKARLSGFPPTRDILEYDILGNSGVLFRILTFACYFIAAVCVHRIIRHGLELSHTQVNVITLMFLVAPINSTRAAMIIMHYSLSFAIFFGAWALVISRRVSVQLIALPLFWISFGTPSLLPFFLLPLGHWIWINRAQLAKVKTQLSILLLLVTPISYWIVRALTFGSGVREYYVPRPLGVVRGGLVVVLAAGIVLYGIVRRKWSLFGTSRPLLAALGFFAVALGASTYMAGGHLVDISDWLISFVPNFSDWDSRHQLLLGLGLAGVVCAALVNPSEPELTKNRLNSIIAVLGVCCVLNFTFSQEYYLDSLKQEQVIAAFKEIPELQTVDTIMIDDQALRFNARGRMLRSFEWQEMINISLEREKPIIVEPLRYVDCTEFNPSAIVQISALNGRLESLVTRNLEIRVTSVPIEPCK